MKEKKENRLVQFFKDEQSRLAGFASKLLSDSSEIDGEDIVQEVFLTLVGRPENTLPEDGISSYVYRSVRNRVTDFFRKRRTQTVSSTDESYDILDLVEDKNSDISTLYELEEQHLSFYEALETLDPLEQKLVIETEFESKPYATLTKETGIATGTLLSKKSRALRKLKKILEEKEIYYAL